MFGMQRKVPLLPKVMQLFEIMARVGEPEEDYVGDESEDSEAGNEIEDLDKQSQRKYSEPQVAVPKSDLD